MARVDVVGIGQSSLDHVCIVDGLPAFAGKAAIERYERMPGGQVATAILACARLGLRTRFVGTVGDDEAGPFVLEPLVRAGVDVTRVQRVPGRPTQLAFILVDRASGERTVLWYRDPGLAPAIGDLRREDVVDARLLHLDGGDPEVAIWAAKIAREEGIPVLIDLDTAGPGLSELLALVDFPIVSRGFAEAYAGTSDPADALAALIAAGARMAVVTLGDAGATARIGDRIIRSPAIRVAVRDSTGAGDAFHAAFGFSVLSGHGPLRALQNANAAAAMNCRALGAQGGLPTRDELERFIEGSTRLSRPSAA